MEEKKSTQDTTQASTSNSYQTPRIQIRYSCDVDLEQNQNHVDHDLTVYCQEAHVCSLQQTSPSQNPDRFGHSVPGTRKEEVSPPNLDRGHRRQGNVSQQSQSSRGVRSASSGQYNLPRYQRQQVQSQLQSHHQVFQSTVVGSVHPHAHAQQPFFYGFQAEHFIESNLPYPPLPLASTTIFGPKFAHNYQHPLGYPTH
jgi:hypothetical protein